MATYFVEINAHYLVKIEHDGSACGAEHHFLDNYAWVWGANAYDEKSMKTECFRGALLTSEIVSEDELKQRLLECEKANDAYLDAERKQELAKAKVDRLLAEAEKAKEELKQATKDMRIAEERRKVMLASNHAQPRFNA